MATLLQASSPRQALFFPPTQGAAHPVSPVSHPMMSAPLVFYHLLQRAQEQRASSMGVERAASQVHPQDPRKKMRQKNVAAKPIYIPYPQRKGKGAKDIPEGLRSQSSSCE